MKKRIILPVAAIGAGVAIKYLKNKKKKDSEKKEEISKPRKIRIRKKSGKISRYLLKILNNVENNRLLFVDIKLISKKLKENFCEQLESLKTEEPVDDIWIAEYELHGSGIVALVNKKAIFYLANFEAIQKIRVSAKTTALKIIGNSLSRLSTRFPLIEKYLFDPMLDIYAPLKETNEISNLGIVSEKQLYRGGMPVGESNYQQLKDLGIKTVVNLKIEDSAVEYVSEQQALAKKGINIHYIPMPNVAPPTMLQTMEFLNLVYNLQTKPVYVHCHRGADRTGVMAAIFRITEGHTASWSLVEAEKFNIASKFFQHKIDFVYNFEKKWNKWKETGKVPKDLNNFDFTNLLEDEDYPENDEGDGSETLTE